MMKKAVEVLSCWTFEINYLEMSMMFLSIICCIVAMIFVFIFFFTRLFLF